MKAGCLDGASFNNLRGLNDEGHKAVKHQDLVLMERLRTAGERTSEVLAQRRSLSAEKAFEGAE